MNKILNSKHKDKDINNYLNNDNNINESGINRKQIPNNENNYSKKKDLSTIPTSDKKLNSNKKDNVFDFIGKPALCISECTENINECNKLEKYQIIDDILYFLKELTNIQA
ncbi:hypothetical protein U3516DRAFT_742091 [Neocallimastix sp. 'constans']